MRRVFRVHAVFVMILLSSPIIDYLCNIQNNNNLYIWQQENGRK